MSRSYKKTPMVKVCDKRPKDWKELYNRKLRRSSKINPADESTWDTISNGGSYKKMNEPWNIYDYKNSESLEAWKEMNPDKDSRQAYRDWYSIYMAK